MSPYANQVEVYLIIRISHDGLSTVRFGVHGWYPWRIACLTRNSEHRLFSVAILTFGGVALVASLMHPHTDSGVVAGVAISQHAVSWLNSIYYRLSLH